MNSTTSRFIYFWLPYQGADLLDLAYFQYFEFSYRYPVQLRITVELSTLGYQTELSSRSSQSRVLFVKSQFRVLFVKVGEAGRTAFPGALLLQLNFFDTFAIKIVYGCELYLIPIFLPISDATRLQLSSSRLCLFLR